MDRAALERALRDHDTRFRHVLDAVQNGLALVSLDGELLVTNSALRTLLGTGSELFTRRLTDLIHPAYLDQVMALLTSRLWSDSAVGPYEVQMTGHDGRTLDVEISLSALRTHHDTHVLIEVRDLTDAHRASVIIRQMADYDRLTGLPNRELLGRHLQRAIIDARAAGRCAAVVLINLDRFKLINDTLGHPSGDRLLKVVGERLQALLPARHIVGRFSGDEFLMVCPDLPNPSAADIAARRVMRAFADGFDHDGQRLQVAATAGIAVFPTHAQDGDAMIRIAAATLHEAKAEGGSVIRMGSSEADARARRRMLLEADLRDAVEQGHLHVAYQPQVSTETGEVLALEALLRWTHPERGTVGPDDFVPLLEETGLIVPVGEMVMRAACREAKAWHDAGFAQVRVAVNVSPRQFLVADFGAQIRDALRTSGMRPEMLEIELTESAGLLDFESVVEVIQGLAEIGVTTAIDDFGIGHSWFGRLQRFPINTLKIDRSFIQRMTASGNDLTIVQAVVALGHALGMSIVAEGVEEPEQLEIACAIGCDAVQGYYFSRPVERMAVIPLLEQYAFRAPRVA